MIPIIYINCIGIFIQYQNKLLPNGSYVRPSSIIYCVHSEALDGVDDGGWIDPDGTPCDSTSSPLQCNDISTAGGPTNITVERVASFANMAAVFKCCLPNDCSIRNGPTDIMIITIYGK